MLNSLPTLMSPSTPAPQAASPVARSESANEPHAERPAFARQLQEAQGGEPAARANAKAAADAHKPSGAKGGAKPNKVAREPSESEEAQALRRAQRESTRPPQAGEAAGDIPPDARAETAQAQGTDEKLLGPDGTPQVLGALLAQLRGQNAASPASGDSGDSEGGVADLSAPGGAPPAAGATRKDKADRAAHLLSGKDQTLNAISLADGRQEGTAAKLMDEQTEQQSSHSAAHGEVVRPADATTTLSAGPGAALPTFAAQLAKSTAAVAQAQLPAPMGSPDFAPQLGTQITTFVRDGVQHAQLHLNPAEMGPVSVQIQLDGQGARVHLMADQANTRQALEQALPQLAGSLREAGLTLTGGGVFQQPRQSGGDGREDGSAKGGRGRGGIQTVGSADGGLTDANARLAGPATSRRRGVVDLIA